MKTLKTIQTLSKIGKILSKIVYICCIVGLCGCAVGAAAMLAGGKVLKLSGMSLHSFLNAEAGISTGTIWSAIIAGAILCTGELFLSRLACRYFENEQNAGTPFTADGAKELLHLGISVVWVPIASIVLAQIAHSVISGFLENVEALNLDSFDSVALGVMLIVASLLCRYGAELTEHTKSE